MTLQQRTAFLMSKRLNDALITFCHQHPIQRLSLFGSMLHGNAHQASDVDLLVEYVNGARVTLLDMAQQEIELRDLFGRDVDLRTVQDLSPYFRQKVINEAVVLYERS
jgi:hypothetical protein